MADYASIVVNKALSMVGYLEKKSNKDLYDKTANAGSNNYTMFAEWYDEGLQGCAWCAMFVSWAAGTSGVPTTVFPKHSYTPTGVNWFKSHGRWADAGSYIPKLGDVIYYHNNVRACHVGLVTKCDGTYVYTVEGNTSSAAGVVANGGAVATKKYRLTYNKILGYGRPDYDSINGNLSTEEVKSIIKEKAPEVISKAITDYYAKKASVGSPSSYATEAWDKMKSAGLMDGTSPLDDITREQTATIISRIESMLNC